MKRLIACAVFATTSVPLANAQDTVPEQPQRCWVAGASFTPGATVRAGETVMECQADFSWASTTKNAAGCLLDGKLNASGAIVDVGPASSSMKIACQLDGTWQVLD